MTRSRRLPDPPPYTDLFGSTESPTEAESGSHTTRQEHGQDALQVMSKAFRVCEDARTLAWMAVEQGTREEGLAALRAFESAVTAARQEFERQA